MPRLRQRARITCALRSPLRWLVVLGLLVTNAAQGAATFPVAYSGRLADAAGAPQLGPVAIAAKFWSSDSGGNQLGPTFDFNGVSLSQGVFSLNFTLTPSQVETIFGDGSDPVFIEISSEGKTYARQKFSFVPLALRVPVDNKTVSFDSNGALSLAVTGAPATNQFLTKDSSGKLVWQTPTVTGGSNNEPTIAGGTASQYWRGDKTWQTLSTATVPESGTAQYYSDARARATLSATAPVTYSVTTGAISLAQASGGSHGYLSSSDWTSFNNKQSALGFSPLNKAGDTMTGELAMGGAKITGLGTPTSIGDAATKAYVDANLGGAAFDQTSKINDYVVKWSSSGNKYVLAADQTGSAGGGITTFNGLNAANQTLAIGTGGTTPTFSSSTSTHTLNIPMASAASVTAGLISNADYASFNAKQAPGNYLTTLTGDITTSGFNTGSAVTTLASVSLGGTSSKVTYDVKGRVTAGTTLSATDIPPLSATSIASGAIAVANGGTGTSSLTANAVLLGNGTSPVQTVTPGASGNVLTSTGTGWQSSALPASVTSVTGTAPISVTTGTTTPVVSIAQANTTTNGFLSAIDWNAFNGKQPAGNYITTLSGDLTTSGFSNGAATATLANVVTAGTSTKVSYDAKGRITAGTTLSSSDIPPLSAASISSGAVAVANGGTGLTAAPANGQIPIGNGTGYTLGTLTAGSGINISNTAGAVTVSATADASTKVSKAGDAMTGGLTLPANGLVAGTNQLVLSGGNVGIGTTGPSANAHILGVSSSPSLSSDTGIFKVTGSVSQSPDLMIGGYATSPWAMWLQTKRSTNDGTLWPLVLNPLGGNVGIGTTSPGSALDVNGIITSRDNATVGYQSGSSGGIYITKTSQYGKPSIQAVTSAFGGDSLLLNPAAGSVGIGTSNLAAKLHVASDTTGATPTILRLSGATNGNRALTLGYETSANHGYIQATETGVGYQNLALNPNGGNVGIGTTNPRNQLQIGDTNNGLGIQIGSTPVASALRFGDNTGWKLNIGRSSESSGGSLNTGYSGVLMTIQDNGNVGIGTTAPANKLHVIGGATFNGSGTTTEIFVRGDSSAVQGTPFGDWQNNGQLIISGSTNTDKRLALGVDTSATNMVGVIQSMEAAVAARPLALNPNGGNVGIGTTAPVAALDVNGTAKIRGGLQPDYDSSWVADNNSTSHELTFTHNLGSIPSRCELRFSPTNTSVTTEYVAPCSGTGLATLNPNTNPITGRLTSTTFIIGIWNGAYLFAYWNTSWTNWNSGYWRVRLWL